MCSSSLLVPLFFLDAVPRRHRGPAASERRTEALFDLMAEYAACLCVCLNASIRLLCPD